MNNLTKKTIILMGVSLIYLQPCLGMEIDENQLSPRSHYLRSVVLEDEGDLVGSTEHLKRAADLNHSKSCKLIAHKYLEGSNGLIKSEKEYAKYLQLAKDLGNQDAENEISFLLKSLDDKAQHFETSVMRKSLRTLSGGAKKIDVGTQYINHFGQFALSFLDVFYEDKVQVAEQILSYCNMAGGFSKIIYGISDTIITDYNYQHLLKSGYGMVQLGSAYLQHEFIEKREQIKKDLKECEAERKMNSKALKELEVFEVFEQPWLEKPWFDAMSNSFCKSIVNKEREHLEIRKKELYMQQCAIDNKCLCTSVAERIIIDICDEYQKNPEANLLDIMMIRTYTGVSKKIPMLFRQNIKARKEEITERINSFIDGVSAKMMPKIFIKLDSVFTYIKKYLIEYQEDFI